MQRVRLGAVADFQGELANGHGRAAVAGFRQRLHLPVATLEWHQLDAVAIQNHDLVLPAPAVCDQFQLDPEVGQETSHIHAAHAVRGGQPDLIVVQRRELLDLRSTADKDIRHHTLVPDELVQGVDD